jgi:hypothetical protein
MNSMPSSIPLPARLLGFGGLIPFFVLAGASLIDTAQAGRWAFALLAYGAVILSFVGALHWGFATLWQCHSTSYRARLMSWSVVPALGAWIALVMPTVAGLGLLCALFVAHHASDLLLARNRELPAWYLRLRTPLTLGAVASLAIVAFNL